MTPSEQIEVSNLHLGTLFPDTSACIPTVIDNAASQGLIADRLIGISFEPTESIEITNGELTFGSTDSSKFTGSITFTSVTVTEPASFYWGINAASNYGGSSVFSSTAGIVDTGTTLVLIVSGTSCSDCANEFSLTCVFCRRPSNVPEPDRRGRGLEHGSA